MKIFYFNTRNEIDQQFKHVEKRNIDIKRAIKDTALAAKQGNERNKTRAGALKTSSFTKVHQVPHQDFNSLEARLTLLEQEPSQSRAAEGDTISFHDLDFKFKIESKV